MTISPALRVFAWLSFIAEVLIIGTGGAVRLTGSGLGCDQWPLCTPGSLVPTEALSWHSYVEFGNRTMTGVVGIVALLTLHFALAAAGGRRSVLHAIWVAIGGIVVAAGTYAIFNMTGNGPAGSVVMSVILLLAVIVGAIYSVKTTLVRRDLLILAWIVLGGVMAQAVVGGSAVLTGLNPFIVGFHYVSSLALVCVTAAFIVRMNATTGPRELATPKWYMIITHVTSLVLAVTIFFGVLTTANGPHSGDKYVERDGFDASLLAHVHSWPGYTLFALALVILIAAFVKKLPTRGWALTFIVALTVQIIVGVIQARDALPPMLVGIHMVIAALSAAAYVMIIFRLKRPVASA